MAQYPLAVPPVLRGKDANMLESSSRNGEAVKPSSGEMTAIGTLGVEAQSRSRTHGRVVGYGTRDVHALEDRRKRDPASIRRSIPAALASARVKGRWTSKTAAEPERLSAVTEAGMRVCAAIPVLCRTSCLSRGSYPQAGAHGVVEESRFRTPPPSEGPEPGWLAGLSTASPLSCLCMVCGLRRAALV